MKHVLFLIGLLVAQCTFAQTSKTTTMVKVVQNSQFGLTYFSKNVDSLRRERVFLDSLLKVNDSLLTRAFTKIPRFNKLLEWHNKHLNAPGWVDSVNALVSTFNEESEYHEKVVEVLNVHVNFFNELLPRVTQRLKDFATKYSTTNNQVVIDWSTYDQVHQEFINWGNWMIDNYNINREAKRKNTERINAALNQMRQN